MNINIVKNESMIKQISESPNSLSDDNEIISNEKNEQNNLEEIKRISETSYPFGTLYEYDNGLKIIKTSNRKWKTKIKYFFLGGVLDQKYDGFAHFIEHSLFFSGVIHKVYSRENFNYDGVTTPYINFYLFEMPHSNIDTYLDEKDYWEARDEATKLIKDNIDIFFNEVDRKDFDFNYFEDEKSIIGSEYGAFEMNNDRAYTDFSNCSLKFYYSNISHIGDAETLKNVTIDDVVEFKKNRYTLENFCFYIDTPLDYEKDLEKLLVHEISKRIKSNPKTKVNINSLLRETIDNERYNISIDKTNGRKYTDITTVFSLPKIDENNINKMIVVYYVLSKLFLMNNHYATKLRFEDRLAYSFRPSNRLDDDVVEFRLSTFISKDKIKKVLIREMQYFKNLITLFDVKDFEEIKLSRIAYRKDTILKFFSTTYDDEEEVYYKLRKLTNKAFSDADQYFDSLTFEDTKKLLEDALQSTKLNVVLKGDFAPEYLPSFDLLKDILHGKQKEISEYAKDMREDINRSKQIFDMGEKLKNNRAIVLYDQSQEEK